ncbi:response regulator transcription factor [Staphylococcus caprae]|uniref:response regulator transcription factor n=1 Tax=Staphylococcus TaxID=1279 RepID=UPI0008A87E70|nr:response regulator transcription factor [Staphylococcus sp. HMSC62A08]OHS39874.1 hypothetical protein HMPREF3264_03545 [Staphylococcus sp. HMSC62A08]
MNKMLVVEDDEEIRNIICEFFYNQDFRIETAYNGLDAIRLGSSKHFDVIILDLMLPFKNGDEVLKELKQITETPIIILSAKSLIQTKVDLFELGADDYVTKPFDMRELQARVEVLLKRQIVCKNIKFKEFILNTDQKVLMIKDAKIPLTLKEYKLLELLFKHPNKVYTKQELYEIIWGDYYIYDGDTINTHISNLRKKIKIHTNCECIQTVWGLGYKLVE